MNCNMSLVNLFCFCVATSALNLVTAQLNVSYQTSYPDDSNGYYIVDGEPMNLTCQFQELPDSVTWSVTMDYVDYTVILIDNSTGQYIPETFYKSRITSAIFSAGSHHVTLDVTKTMDEGKTFLCTAGQYFTNINITEILGKHAITGNVNRFRLNFIIKCISDIYDQATMSPCTNKRKVHLSDSFFLECLLYPVLTPFLSLDYPLVNQCLR